MKAEFDEHGQEDAKAPRRSNCSSMCQSSFGTCLQNACGGRGACWNNCVSATQDCESSCR
jgi:hypothetical protein